ncbi:MAG: class I SAM-dependent methyltransferase [Pyrinomonadaceae bacterium]|nr:class I SAM-dependent methyltransferase [Phycisphaerales bacterium]
MPMTQDDIRLHYESSWKTQADSAQSSGELAYSCPVEDAVLYPIYERLLHDLQIKVTGGRVLDVGSGSGRWIRFLLGFVPQHLAGVDFTQSAIDLLRKWCPSSPQTRMTFERADITAPSLELSEPGPYDLINIANVLFHIPESEKFISALCNLSQLLSPTGRIVTTEYLPRNSMRTRWMLVRSRYEFQEAVEAANLRIVDIRATSFFSNDPMGIDGPDSFGREEFRQVRAAQQMLLRSNSTQKSLDFFRDLFIASERAALAYCAERIAPIDMPSQKLVTLARA